MKSKQISSLYSSKVFFFSLSVLLVFIGWKFVSLSSQTIESQTKIAALHSELEQMQLRQENLKRMEAFFKSDFFAEREARMKFGLQKKDEHMVILKDESKPLKDNREVIVDGRSIGKNIDKNSEHSSIRSQWWDYFFSH